MEGFTRPRKIIRKNTPEQIVAMLNREDYYKILKIRYKPKDALNIKWNTLRSKWSILNQNGCL